MDAHWLVSFSMYGTWLPHRAETRAVDSARPALRPARRRRSPGARIRDGPGPSPVADRPPAAGPARARAAAPTPRSRARISDGPPLPAVGRYASLAARAGPVHLTYRQASRVIMQLRETARVRGWALRAAAVTRHGVHAVVEVNGEALATVVLADLKGDAGRALSAARGGPPQRWWNEGGTRRRLGDGDAIAAAIRQVRDQRDALATWIDPRWPRP